MHSVDTITVYNWLLVNFSGNLKKTHSRKEVKGAKFVQSELLSDKRLKTSQLPYVSFMSCSAVNSLILTTVFSVTAQKKVLTSNKGNFYGRGHCLVLIRV